MQRKKDAFCIHCGINRGWDAKGSTPEYFIQSEPNHVGSENYFGTAHTVLFCWFSSIVYHNTKTLRFGSRAGCRNVVFIYLLHEGQTPNEEYRSLCYIASSKPSSVEFLYATYLRLNCVIICLILILAKRFLHFQRYLSRLRCEQYRRRMQTVHAVYVLPKISPNFTTHYSENLTSHRQTWNAIKIIVSLYEAKSLGVIMPFEV
jgi:hypothetical protein